MEICVSEISEMVGSMFESLVNSSCFSASEPSIFTPKVALEGEFWAQPKYNNTTFREYVRHVAEMSACREEMLTKMLFC